jgi:hypothetical protein
MNRALYTVASGLAGAVLGLLLLDPTRPLTPVLVLSFMRGKRAGKKVNVPGPSSPVLPLGRGEIVAVLLRAA